MGGRLTTRSINPDVGYSSRLSSQCRTAVSQASFLSTAEHSHGFVNIHNLSSMPLAVLSRTCSVVVSALWMERLLLLLTLVEFDTTWDTEEEGWIVDAPEAATDA
jgi:hypothetical protein